jgi:hypothetical protein
MIAAWRATTPHAGWPSLSRSAGSRVSASTSSRERCARRCSDSRRRRRRSSKPRLPAPRLRSGRSSSRSTPTRRRRPKHPGLNGSRAPAGRSGDVQREIQRFAGANLTELVASAEADGAAAAEAVTKSAEALVAAYRKRKQIAGEISGLVTLAGNRIRPGDVSRSRAESLARAAGALVGGGGEDPPVWRPCKPQHVAPLAGSLT